MRFRFAICLILSWFVISAASVSAQERTVQQNLTELEAFVAARLAEIRALLNPPSSPCTFTLGASTVSVGEGSSVGTVPLTVGPPQCEPSTWTASSAVAWLTLSSATGTGSAQVGYTVASNAITAPRTGVLTIAGQAFTVTQAGAPPPPSTGGLCVDAARGDDALTIAQVRAGGCWRSIGRAAWGSSNRGAPNPGEAARAGDTVQIAGGTYTTAVAVNNRWGVVYNPANSGTASQPITFACVGTCVLGAQNANAPVIGAEAKNYIRWVADVTQGHAWSIRAYGRQAGTAAVTEVNTTPDTGPVVCHGATGCTIDGATIDGGLQTDYTDNYDGIRVEGAPGAVIRNNTIRNFRNGGNTANGGAIKLYGSPNSIVEHNFASGMGTAIGIKDTSFMPLQNNLRIRFNRFDGVDRCLSWSTTAEDRNYVYQNVCTNSGFALFITGGGLSNDWIVNNTFVNIRDAGLYPTSLGGGGRFWNNILVNAATVVLLEAAPMVPASTLSLEHNVYFGHPRFYAGTDGIRTLAGFRTAFPTQEQASPLSVEANPLFVGAADFRLQPTSPALTRGVDILDLNGDGSTTDLIPAGASVSGAEVFGPRVIR